MADPRSEQGDRFEELLERYDEALLREGVSAAAPESGLAPGASGQGQEDLDDAFRCLRLLEQVWPRHAHERPAGRNARAACQAEAEEDATFVRGQGDAMPPTATLPQGLVLGDYRLIRELGRGGMGIVYEAWQVSLSRRVAVKLLRTPAPLLTESNRRRFDNETRAAAALDNEHIVKIYAVGCQGDTPYYAMQLIDGATLAEWIAEWRRRVGQKALSEPSTRVRLAEDGGRPDDDAVSPAPDRLLAEVDSPAPGSAEFYRHAARLCRQACLALEHAHAQGVIHRDVKPANMLVCSQWRLWVTDFGLARIGGDSNLTLSGEQVGTLRYMSPEQALGKRNIDYRTDIYSLGVTLYEMTTLTPLFAEEDRQALLHSITHESPPPPRKLAPQLPRDLETIVLKATAKAPGERYETARQFAEDLRRFLNLEPILARRVGAVDRGLKWMRRNGVTVAATLFTAALLLGALFIMAWSQGRRYRDLADENRLIARKNREVAEENRRAADALREQIYVADVKLADRAAAKGNVRAAGQYLDRSSPRPGERDLRGFEWRYLNAQLRRQATSIQASPRALYFVVHSPDGQRIATAGADAVLRIHDARRGRVLSEITTGQVEVNGVAFSPDGRRLASAGDDGAVRVWDLSSRRELLNIEAHQDKAYQVAFSADGAELYSCGSGDKNIRAWNATSGKPINALTGHAPFECLALAPNRRWLAAGDENGELFIFDMTSHKIALCVRISSGKISGLAFSRDEQLLGAACTKNQCRVLTIPQMLTIATYNLPDPLTGVSLSRDGLHAAASDRGGDVTMYATREALSVDIERQMQTMNSEARPQRWRRHEGPSHAVSFSPTDNTLASVGADGRLQIWPTACKQIVHIVQPGTPTSCWAWLPDSEHIAAWDEFSTLYKVARDGGVARLQTSPAESAFRPVFALERSRFAVGDDRSFLVCSMAQPRQWRRFDYPTRAYRDLVFSPDGRLVAAGGRGTEEVLVIDAGSGRLLRKLPCRPRSSGPPAISGDGKLLAIGIAERGHVDVWRLDPLLRIAQFPGPRSGTKAIVFSPRSDWVACVGVDRSLRVWDLSTNRERFSAVEHEAPLYALAVSPDGRTLATGDERGVVMLWSAVTGEVLLELTQAAGKRIERIEFSPDGRRLAWSLKGQMVFCDVLDR